MKNIGFRLIVSAFLIFNGLFVWQVAAATQIDIPGPAGGGGFGRQVVALPNGNIVVTDPQYNGVGAVYLYNGATGALISRLTETYTTNITTLPNGKFVLTDGSFDAPGVLDVGAVYLYNGVTGALISRLTGSRAFDYIGNGGVKVLPNGNYVVITPSWNNDAIDVGAVTVCSGTTGCEGVVSSANSLIGLTAGDRIGSYGITILTNGNYVVNSPGWNNGATFFAGAVTFCNGTTNCTGVVSAANSLVGSTTYEYAAITVLTNGNYVVSSGYWDNGKLTDVGAVTFCNGTSGCTGTRTSANSLVGSTTYDHVSLGVLALPNGNYVVNSADWDNGATTNVGAVTFCNGTTGCVGVVSSANSLIGSTANDSVGYAGLDPGLIALTNGNYVVDSHRWDNGATTDVGAITLCNGTTGCTGVVSPANSLLGSTAGDRIGNSGVTALTNGNYVVSSRDWDNGATANVGAATFCNGTSGCTGAVSSANSLIGSSAGDNVGTIYFRNGVTALTNGNYVVNSPGWNNGASVDAGAVTFCNGTSGCTGAVSSTNSLVGSTAAGSVGSVVVALTNGNYVVGSLLWNNGAIMAAGAVTWCNGISGCTGAVTSANSLVGSTAGDRIGSTVILNPERERITVTTITALPNGNYVVDSPIWDNGAIINAGAITYGDGSDGTFGAITAANSVRGTTNGCEYYCSLPYAFDAANNQLVVGRPLENIVTLFRKTQTPTGIVSGSIIYGNASTTTPVPFTTLNAAGSIPLSILTDANGFYSIIGFGSGAYTITPTKNNQVNGISNLDASLVAQHIVGLVKLTANQQIAADTSGNGAISSLDVAYIAQFVTATANPSITGTWKFLPASRSYPNVTANQTNHDYSAILVGEVTGNWNPLGALGSELSIIESALTKQPEKTAEDKKSGKEAATLTVQAEQSAAEKTELTVKLTAAETIGEDVLSYQFDLLYDAAVIKPQAIGCDVEGTMSQQMTAVCHEVETGVLKVVVFGAKPISGSGTLLKLKFNVVGARSSTSPLTVKNFIFNEDIAQEIMTDGQVLVADSRTETVSIRAVLKSVY